MDGVLVAVVSDVGERRTLTSPDGGTFTVQSVKLSQGSDWMFAEFSNLGDVSCCDGREIELSCTTSRHGTQGVSVKDSVRGDRTFKNLRITPSAKFLVGEMRNEPVVSKRQQLRNQRK
jgi:hypothetical protein